MYRCKRCNKELTDPESIARGYGEICAAKIGIPLGKGTKKAPGRKRSQPPTSFGLQESLFDLKVGAGITVIPKKEAISVTVTGTNGHGNTTSKTIDLLQPDPADIVLKRINNSEVETNVRHAKVYHSPDGFNWGYAGSGPAELALNILIMFTDEATAFRLHQTFKEEYLIDFPEEGGTIEADEIRAWIEEKLDDLD